MGIHHRLCTVAVIKLNVIGGNRNHFGYLKIDNLQTNNVSQSVFLHILLVLLMLLLNSNIPVGLLLPPLLSLGYDVILVVVVLNVS